ncbi:MAG: histidine kinase dimerization/phospho-acceptor domain-containing protein [Pseudomonadota bacterium]
MSGERTDAASEGAHDCIAAWLNLSHELRTPANAILGHLELLLNGSAGPLSSEMRGTLGEIQRAALTLSTQISEAIERAENIPLRMKVDTDQAR